MKFLFHAAVVGQYGSCGHFLYFSEFWICIAVPSGWAVGLPQQQQFGDQTNPSGTSAGGHFRIPGEVHKLPPYSGRHLGDMVCLWLICSVATFSTARCVATVVHPPCPSCCAGQCGCQFGRGSVLFRGLLPSGHQCQPHEQFYHRSLRGAAPGKRCGRVLPALGVCLFLYPSAPQFLYLSLFVSLSVEESSLCLVVQCFFASAPTVHLEGVSSNLSLLLLSTLVTDVWGNHLPQGCWPTNGHLCNWVHEPCH